MQSNHEKLLPISRNLNNYIIKLTTTILKDMNFLSQSFLILDIRFQFRRRTCCIFL
uniref:Uncharacterized protein n=1 Tax=Manihot esculenta TaxID=3983 RepID=A0A2C9W6V7_MANES